MAVLDGHLADAGPAHPGVPPLDVGDADPGDRHLRQRIGQDGRRPAGVVPPGRGRPGRLVLFHPLGEEVRHCGAGCPGDRPDRQLRGDPQGVPLRAPDRPAHLRRAAALVPAGEGPDLPHPRLALTDGRHARHRVVGIAVGMRPIFVRPPTSADASEISECARQRSRVRSPVAGSARCPRRGRRSWRRGASARRGSLGCSRNRRGSGWPVR